MIHTITFDHEPPYPFCLECNANYLASRPDTLRRWRTMETQLIRTGITHLWEHDWLNPELA
jgi:hypothetical protein